MFGDGGLRHREWFGQLSDSRFAGREPGENGAAGWIGESGESGIEARWRGVYITHQLYNLMVV
jgi:hypothetical protein